MTAKERETRARWAAATLRRWAKALRGGIFKSDVIDADRYAKAASVFDRLANDQRRRRTRG